MDQQTQIQTISLDQNKWIQLAQAWMEPNKYRHIYEVLEFLIDETENGRMQTPLHHTNIYETLKINKPKQRKVLSYVQATLSGGLVFVASQIQRSMEIKRLLRVAFSIPQPNDQSGWFVTHKFWEAIVSAQTLSEGIDFSSPVFNLAANNPVEALFSYLNDLDDVVRRQAVRDYSSGILDILSNIEQRRKHYKSETVSIRRKAMSVHMFMDYQDDFWKEVDALGIRTKDFKNSGNSLKRDLIRKVPSLHIERELALKIEAEPVEFKENDVRDLQLFCSAIPYSDFLVAEHQFTNRAMQAGLGEKYNTKLLTDIRDLLP